MYELKLEFIWIEFFSYSFKYNLFFNSNKLDLNLILVSSIN